MRVRVTPGTYGHWGVTATRFDNLASRPGLDYRECMSAQHSPVIDRDLTARERALAEDINSLDRRVDQHVRRVARKSGRGHWTRALLRLDSRSDSE